MNLSSGQLRRGSSGTLSVVEGGRRAGAGGLLLAATLLAGCAPHRGTAVVPGPTVTETVTLTPSPTQPVLPSLQPVAGGGPVVLGPQSGTGSEPLGTVDEAGTQSLTVSAVCTGGGQLTVVATSGVFSRPYTVSCTGSIAPPGSFPAYEFTGTLSLGIAGLAGQHWSVLVQRSVAAG
ncbi:MAG: hypothetical protein ACYDAQ_21250 [Mycobacteriales bacterium]